MGSSLFSKILVLRLSTDIVKYDFHYHPFLLGQQKHQTNTLFAAAKYIFAPEKTKVFEDLPQTRLEGKVSLVMLENVLESFSRTKMRRSSISEENEVSSDQNALFKSDLSYVTIDKIENYFILLTALDRNLKEHKRLRRILAQASKIIKILNDRSEAKMNDVEKRILRERSRSVMSLKDTTQRPSRLHSDHEYSDKDFRDNSSKSSLRQIH